MIPLTQKIGDNKTYRIPLTWEGRPFRASEDWLLTFTLKVDPDTENDEDALIQKVTGAGILNAGNDALVSIVPIDTRGDAEADPVVAEIDPGSYYWGILAQNTDTGERRHVQLGKLKLEQAVTRDDETAIPIYTTNPPAYPISGSVRYDEEQTLTNPQKAQAKENIGIPIDNFTAVAAPTVNDDVTEGYSQGSKWYDSVGQEAYLCVNATNGAAVWIMTTLTADELGSAAFTDSTDYATAAQGDLADSSLQPVAVDYRGAYNNGDSTYAVGSVVLYNELLYIKISNPGNPGYPPGGADWELFEPEIGSPAYDLWVQTLLDSKANNQDLADYLPLAGGIMDDNATIGWDNAAAIREAGAQGLEIECSAGYRWQWVAGRMILRQINSEQIARIIAIDGINPTATDDITKYFVPGTRWETVDGTIYVCTDSTEDAAVWRREYNPNASVTIWQYRAETGIITGNPTSGKLIWNDAVQIDATEINVSHKDQHGSDIEFFLGFLQEGQQIFLQDRDASQNFQLWTISGTPTLTGGGTANAYFTFPVTIAGSGGTGNTGFADNHQLLFGISQAISNIIKVEGGGVVVTGTSNPTSGGANTGIDSFISGSGNHSNSAFSCLIGGDGNHSNSGSYTAISGSGNHTNSGFRCLISGNNNHTNGGNSCLISGANNDSNTGSYCSISGYGNHSNTGTHSQISGYGNSTNSGSYCQINGASNYGNSGTHCQISGAGSYSNHSNSGNYCSISGSSNFLNSGNFCSISGYNSGSNSGDYCQIFGNNNYQNTGNHCQISGYGNSSNTGSHCKISGYGNNNNSGDYCAIGGFYNYSNYGSHCLIIGEGHFNNSGSFCLLSGNNANFNTLSYSRAHGGGAYARIIDVVARTATTGNTPTTLTLGGEAEDATNRINIPANSTWSFTATIVARQTSTANAKTWTRRGLIGNNAGAVTISALDTIGTDHVLGTLAASIAITADNTNDALKIVGTGVAATDIAWTAQVSITQVG